MTEQPDPQRFRLLAAFIVGRPVDIARAPAGQPAHTDGRVINVSDSGEQRRELVLQCALLAAGSLDRSNVRALRGRAGVAQRYLALEGRRALAALAPRLPLAATLCPDVPPLTETAAASLDWARSRRPVAPAPAWFGVVKPSILRTPEEGTTAGQAQASPGVTATGSDEDDDGEAGQSEDSVILKLFEAPAFTSRMLSEFLRKMFGGSRTFGGDDAGAELPTGSVRQGRRAGTAIVPLPTRIEFTGTDRPVVGVGGALYPEWDAHRRRYRPQWCRVVDYPLTGAGTGSRVVADPVLRQRLSRVGLGPKVLHARPDGDDLDTEALVGLIVDLHSGHTAADHIHLDRRNLNRNLGVLILLDVSGSVTDTDADGMAVHDLQRQAAATLAATLEELGDRVAVYGFRSHGRHAVHLPAVKTFDQCFGAAERARLELLRPSGYTRLGAAVRGAGQIVKTQAGTPHRLLLVLSDGYPYDDGYEGRYAQADSAKALEELRGDGVACLCLSIGATADQAAHEQVFGAAGRASAATLAELSPRMDELFLTSLRELAAPKPR